MFSMIFNVFNHSQCFQSFSIIFNVSFLRFEMIWKIINVFSAFCLNIIFFSLKAPKDFPDMRPQHNKSFVHWVRNYLHRLISIQLYKKKLMQMNPIKFSHNWNFFQFAIEDCIKVSCVMTTSAPGSRCVCDVWNVKENLFLN